MKKRHLAGLIGLLVALAVAYAYNLYSSEVDLGSRMVTVIIEPGDTFVSVANRLVAEGVVTSRIMLVYPARILGIDKKLVPGRYDFAGRNSCRSVLDRLERGDFLRVRVTIPEGTPIWQVASIVASSLDLDSATIVDANQDSALLAQMDIPCLEGYLFPETYIFAWGVSETEVLTTMLNLFKARTDTIWPDSTPRGLSRHEIMTLASIVEAETKLDEERGLVASVYLNRLCRNMKLDADPTVIYGLGGLDRPLYRKDLRKDTPHNTYIHRGLPPTPINSPGLAAIMAALRPAESDYLYFLANEAGGHTFSRTNAEHNRARREIRTHKRTSP